MHTAYLHTIPLHRAYIPIGPDAKQHHHTSGRGWTSPIRESFPELKRALATSINIYTSRLGNFLFVPDQNRADFRRVRIESGSSKRNLTQSITQDISPAKRYQKSTNRKTSHQDPESIFLPRAREGDTFTNIDLGAFLPIELLINWRKFQLRSNHKIPTTDFLIQPNPHIARQREGKSLGRGIITSKEVTPSGQRAAPTRSPRVT